MVQIVRRTPQQPRQRKPTFAELIGLKEIGQSFAKGITSGLEEQRKAKQSKEILDEENKYFEENLGVDLSGISDPKIRQQTVVDALRGKREEQDYVKRLQSFQNIQNIYKDPNLSDEQKVFGVYQELSQNPTLAHNLLGSLQKPGKAHDEEIASEQYTKGYNAILEGDNDAFKEVLEDPATPLSVKNKLTNLRDKSEIRKGVKNRELRNRQSMVQNAYKQAIANERAKIQKPGGYPRQEKKEIDAIAKNIKNLEAFQKADMKRLAKDPDSYNKLRIWDNDAGLYLPEEEGGQQNQPDQNAEALLNSLSDEQIAELFQDSRGNIEEAKKIALERYGR